MNPSIAIREIMTKELVTVRPETAAEKIERVFEEHSFHHLPVVSEGNKLEGIISREDFLKVAYVLSLNTGGRTYTEKEYDRLRARDFMTKYPMALDPDDTIGLAADIFLANKFHALPITEDGELQGLVTTHDLLKHSFKSPIPSSEQTSDSF
jgi:acetoin utilization protein AcuB